MSKKTTSKIHFKTHAFSVAITVIHLVSVFLLANAKLGHIVQSKILKNPDNFGYDEKAAIIPVRFVPSFQRIVHNITLLHLFFNL